jgi:hypothetical protein
MESWIETTEIGERLTEAALGSGELDERGFNIRHDSSDAGVNRLGILKGG